MEYHSYRLIQKYRLFDEDISSEMQKMCKKVTVQIKDEVFNGKDKILLINCFTDSKLVCDSLRKHKGATVWLFSYFMNGPDLTATKMWLILLSSDANRHDGTTTTCAGILNHLWNRYATDTVFDKAEEELHNFRQGW